MLTLWVLCFKSRGMDVRLIFDIWQWSRTVDRLEHFAR